jgi:hypothetical protein
MGACCGHRTTPGWRLIRQCGVRLAEASGTGHCIPVADPVRLRRSSLRYGASGAVSSPPSATGSAFLRPLTGQSERKKPPSSGGRLRKGDHSCATGRQASAHGQHAVLRWFGVMPSVTFLADCARPAPAPQRPWSAGHITRATEVWRGVGLAVPGGAGHRGAPSDPGRLRWRRSSAGRAPTRPSPQHPESATFSEVHAPGEEKAALGKRAAEREDVEDALGSILSCTGPGL